MSLIKSISGIRGTIGGKAGDNLTPQDIVECTAAFGYWLLQKGAPPRVVIGRDARTSGSMVSRLAANTLVGLGMEVIDLGLSTTPTVAMAVPYLEAGAGIIITASHNPENWNALKFVDHNGEFISKADGESLLRMIDEGRIEYASVQAIGRYKKKEGLIDRHIEAVLNHELVQTEKVRARRFRVAVDCVNSTGAISIPPLLEKLGCEVVVLNGEPNGKFAHNPEPLPENLAELSRAVVQEKCDLGIAVDPDVDRLALVSETGEMFGEEYTLVAVADYFLQHRPGNTVSNLSSTRALRDVTRKYGGTYFAAAVGEVNVVEKMKAVGAVIGGEGNGGVIVPDLHYGRDALAGVALFLSYLAQIDMPVSKLRESYPAYFMVKDKIELTPDVDVDNLIEKVYEKFQREECNTEDGLKIDFEDGWVHLRKSNTEPIIRIYSEGKSPEKAGELAGRIKRVVVG